MKGTPPNKGAKMRQTKATPVPSGMAAKKLNMKGDPRSGKGLPGVGGGGSNAGAKVPAGIYDTTRAYRGNAGTKSGKGKTQNFKRS